MPYVMDGERGRVDIASHCERREITFAVDPIRQEPVVAVEVRTAENVKTALPPNSGGRFQLAQNWPMQRSVSYNSPMTIPSSTLI